MKHEKVLKFNSRRRVEHWPYHHQTYPFVIKSKRVTLSYSITGLTIFLTATLTALGLFSAYPALTLVFLTAIAVSVFWCVNVTRKTTEYIAYIETATNLWEIVNIPAVREKLPTTLVNDAANLLRYMEIITQLAKKKTLHTCDEKQAAKKIHTSTQQFLTTAQTAYEATIKSEQRNQVNPKWETITPPNQNSETINTKLTNYVFFSEEILNTNRESVPAWVTALGQSVPDSPKKSQWKDVCNSFLKAHKQILNQINKNFNTYKL